VTARWETRLLAVVVAVLAVVGVASVYGASSIDTTGDGPGGAGFALRQALGVVIGGLTASLVARLDYRAWQRAAWPLVGIVTGLLLVLLLPFTRDIAPTLNGARRWLYLGPFSFQPSEPAKFALVVWTAMLAAKKGDQIRTFRRGLLPVVVIVLPVAGLIFLQPNLSMAILGVLAAGVVLFAAGARIGHFLLLGAAAVPLLYGAIANAQYRLARLVSFLNSGAAPEETMTQVHESLVGIGAGRLLGVGFGAGQQKLGYLPYAYSDFIFSTIGEEWGFVGVLVLALLFGAFVWIGARIARAAPDLFGQCLAAGLTAMIGLAVLLHIGVNLAVIPASGIPLPFVSYGRSALVVAFAATGVLISIGQRSGRRSAAGGGDA
jgi:cell division protein FtsW